ncbi:Rv3235 family protein [Solihabitans fulvus]|uniref:Rv3235 family protein n=1 Tax=Solihabitans fulvus TaxID=1892852 RepID=UPI001661E398|nr:Rv3235 family protein [Solihabitans fulvus]
MLRPLRTYEPPTTHHRPTRTAPRPTLVTVLPPDEPEAPPPLTGPIAWRLLSAVLETLDGRRTMPQLRGLVADSVHDAIRREVHGHGHGHCVRTEDRQIWRLHRVRACHPAPGVVELAGTAGRGRRIRALAARAEQRGTRWICTEFAIVGDG